MASASALTLPVAVPAEILTVRPGRSAGPAVAGGLLFAIAFLLGLTTARNSDVWAHLASGRAIVSPSVGGTVRPDSWLADVAMFLTYTVAGGAGLVLAKAGLLAATAAAIWGGGPSARSVIAAFLAVLALGGWVPLSPVCIGYLFLALSLRALNRADLAGGPTGWRHALRSHGWLILMFVVWANVGVACLLGIAVVGFYAFCKFSLVGVSGQGSSAAAWRLFVLVLPATAVSLMPWHAATALREVKELASTPEAVLSPFRKAVFEHIGSGWIEGYVPPLAFWLLTVVAIGSTLVAARVEPREARTGVWARAACWLALFVAAAMNGRFVPFSIVAGGIVASLNLATLWPHRTTVVRSRTRIDHFRLAVGAAVILLATTVLLGAAWAGWLQPVPFERRNWTVEADPSLVRAAEVVENWRAAGLLEMDQHPLFLATEAEETFRWFAPGVMSARPAGAGLSMGQVRAVLLSAEPRGLDPLLDPAFACVVVSDPYRGAFATAMSRLMAAPDRWKLAHLRGRAAVFVRAGSPLPAVDLTARAFSLSTADRAADTIASFAVEEDWYDAFLVTHLRSMDRDEAVTYLLLDEVTRGRRRTAAAGGFLSALAGSVVGTAAPAHWTMIDPRLVILRDALKSVASATTEATPFPYDRFAAFQLLANGLGDAYLAVRAGRRAVAAAPRDAASYEALGEAYLHLLADPIETAWAQKVPALRRLRLVQAAAAYRRATTLDPGRPAAHRGLVAVYLENGFLDLALTELQAAHRLAGHADPGEADRLQALGEAVRQARQAVQANAANLAIGDRAKLAARNGLAGEALDLLLQSDVAAFGPNGLAQELDLMLAVGRALEARDWLEPRHREQLGTLNYDWLAVQAAAALGDYDGAAAGLRSQIASLPSTQPLMPAKDFWAAVSLAGKEVLNRRQNEAHMMIALGTSLLAQFASAGRQILFERQTKTEDRLLLSLLALEQGDVAAASRHAEDGRGIWADVDVAGVAIPSPQRIVLGQMASLIRP